jgi:small conductance mechanosensitive channel
VSYQAELDHIIRILNEVGVELSNDSKYKEMIIKAPHFLRVDDFTDSAMALKIVGETLPNRQWEVTGELRRRIKQAFDREHIEIPLPQRVIHQYAHRGKTSSGE